MMDSEAKDDNEDLLEALGSGEGSQETGENADEVFAFPEASNQPFATIESLQQQLGEANDRVLRAQADLENYRKRVRRDMDEQRLYANLPLVSDLIPAFDNLDRAVDAAERNENATGLLEGVKMVTVQIQSILEQHNCRRLAASDCVFDPHFHQAIAQEPSESVPAGNITRQVQVGYQLHDRVIRPSQVMVSTGAPRPPANE
ncbi:MAG: nucleotide exchange factor GrpE [Planctomycetota bacterium]